MDLVYKGKREKAPKSELLLTCNMQFNAIWFNDEQGVVLYQKHEKMFKISWFGLDYSAVTGCDLREDGTSITGGRLGAAAVGGLAFGAAGAIAGSAMSRKSQGVCTELALVIKTNDRKEPMVKVDIIAGDTKKTSFSYKKSLENALAAHAKLTQIAEDNKAAKSSATTTPSGSVADELIKLKGLMDAGVLTEEEFEAQKKALLG